jgi:hypothetical protein
MSFIFIYSAANEKTFSSSIHPLMDAEGFQILAVVNNSLVNMAI